MFPYYPDKSFPIGEHWLSGSHGGRGISRRPRVGSADCAGRHLWLRARVGSADRAIVIYAYEGQWALGIVGSSIA